MDITCLILSKVQLSMALDGIRWVPPNKLYFYHSHGGHCNVESECWRLNVNNNSNHHLQLPQYFSNQLLQPPPCPFNLSPVAANVPCHMFILSTKVACVVKGPTELKHSRVHFFLIHLTIYNTFCRLLFTTYSSSTTLHQHPTCPIPI